MKKLMTILALVAAISAGAQTPREKINFDDNWQFAFGDASSPAKDFEIGRASCRERV